MSAQTQSAFSAASFSCLTVSLTAAFPAVAADWWVAIRLPKTCGTAVASVPIVPTFPAGASTTGIWATVGSEWHAGTPPPHTCPEWNSPVHRCGMAPHGKVVPKPSGYGTGAACLQQVPGMSTRPPQRPHGSTVVWSSAPQHIVPVSGPQPQPPTSHVLLGSRTERAIPQACPKTS